MIKFKSYADPSPQLFDPKVLSGAHQVKLGFDKVVIGLNLLWGFSHDSYQFLVISDLVNFGEDYVHSFVEILQFLYHFQILACDASVGLNTK